MKKFIYIVEDNDPQHAVLMEMISLNDLKVILIGDYYHDKICEKVEGFIECLKLYELEHSVCKIEVEELDSDTFYKEDFSINGNFICLGGEEIGFLSFKRGVE